MSVCLTVLTHAEVIDRIIAVVEGHIITLSDLRQEREIRATLGEKAIDDNVTVQQVPYAKLREKLLAGSQILDAEAFRQLELNKP